MYILFVVIFKNKLLKIEFYKFDSFHRNCMILFLIIWKMKINEK